MMIAGLILAACLGINGQFFVNADTAGNMQSSSSEASSAPTRQSTQTTSHVDKPNPPTFPAAITGHQNINQTAEILDSSRNDGVFANGPALTSADTMAPESNGSQLNGRSVNVLAVVNTVRSNGQRYDYAKVQDLANQRIFWIDERAILATMISQKDVQYQAIIISGQRNDGIYNNGPALSNWAALKADNSAKNVDGRQVTVLKEAETLRGNGQHYYYVQVHDPVSNQDYWLDRRALTLGQYAVITSHKTVNQYAEVTNQRNDGIYNNGPALTNAASLSPQGYGNRYAGLYLQVTELAVTQRATGRSYEYAKVTNPENGESFWIDSRSLAISDFASIINQTPINQTATIRDSSRNDAVYNNGPALTNINTLAASNQGQKINGRQVIVLNAVKTRRANGREYDYDQIQDGTQTYWIDQRAVLASVSYKNVSYQAIINTINRTDDFYFNNPALTNWQTLSANGSDRNRNGHKVQVLQEVYTLRGDGNRYTYLKVQDGITIYWLDKRAFLFPNQSVTLSFHHFNQNQEGAPEGCEGASLQTALSVKGRYLSLRQIYNATGYGWSISPYNGFHGNPFGGGTFQTQTVYAEPLARATKKFYNGISNMTGANVNDVIYQLQQGNPVVTWASYTWTVNPANFHVMCIVGYRPGYFQISDPIFWGNSYWISTKTWQNVNQNEKTIGFSTPRSMNIVVK
ncbi:MAG: GW dipeptide domain-containing protein [Oenococcus sp.]|uniref:GW dipeptide domain-containing protein n=1 Tax=Oenococcus sp. TaxID=1979414 RepID=UPI0039EB7F9B